MDYHFDALMNRRDSDSMKWNVGENELPMWVADMDFQTAPEIIQAIQERANHGIFGYTEISEEWYQAIIEWWSVRHHFEIRKEWLVFCTGVVPAISSIVRKLTTVGEKVVVQTPAYQIFFNSIINNGRQILESPLEYDGAAYYINFKDLELKLADPQTTMLILCNPHNPVGKIWNKETLEQIGELCWKHHVIVLSDEIHCDLTDPRCEYLPFASVSEKCRLNSISCIAPTKAFNLAGLQTSAVFVPNEVLRHKVNRAFNTDEVAEPNAFAVKAAIAAFTKGAPWLDSLREYIFSNKAMVENFLITRVPQISLVHSQATYLLWLDCKGLGDNTEGFCKYLKEQTGLYLSAGSQYGGNGASFLRMNIACPRERLMDGLNRLEQGTKLYIEHTVTGPL